MKNGIDLNQKACPRCGVIGQVFVVDQLNLECLGCGWSAEELPRTREEFEAVMGGAS